MSAPRLDFVRAWEPPERLLGGKWALLGDSWTLLGASSALLGRLLGALGGLLATKCCPRRVRTRFWRVLGGSGEGLGDPKVVFFDVFSYIWLYNGFNTALTTLLHFPTFSSYFFGAAVCA